MQIKPFVKNAKQHPEKQLKAIARSIERFGFRQPIVIDKDDTIVVGHGRYLAATQILGLSEFQEGASAVKGEKFIPFQRITDLTVDEVKAYRLADNKLNETDWDEILLAESLKELSDELQSDAGFSEREVTAALNKLLNGEEDDFDSTLPTEPRTKRGDMWILGEHILLCGDATKREDVERLMGGEKADMTFTDPPYSVNYDRSQKERGGSKEVHESYHEAEIDPLVLLEGFLSILPSDVLVMTYPVDRHFFALAGAFKKTGWEFRKELIWVKDLFSFWPGAQYQQKHEPIMVCAKKGKTIEDANPANILHDTFLVCVKTGKPLNSEVPANFSTVLEFKRPKRHDLHPTAKPVELWVKIMSFHTSIDRIIYDPFGGCGTTIIACEQTKRKCRMMEIDEKYCDVIVARWEKLTEKKAVLQV